jgi:hypothetical protein
MPKIVWSKPGGFDCVIREVVLLSMLRDLNSASELWV